MKSDIQEWHGRLVAAMRQRHELDPKRFSAKLFEANCQAAASMLEAGWLGVIRNFAIQEEAMLARRTTRETSAREEYL